MPRREQIGAKWLTDRYPPVLREKSAQKSSYLNSILNALEKTLVRATLTVVELFRIDETKEVIVKKQKGCGYRALCGISPSLWRVL